VFEQKLRAAQIPYKVSGGQSFFDRAEIKDLCAWLRLLVNQDDDPAFLRAVTTPKRGIGHQTLASAGRVRVEVEDSLFEALFSPSLGSALKGKAIDRCTSSAARSTTSSTAPATPPGPRTPRRCCWAG
jgi:ATP-dependent DNA helicase Rep